MSSILGTPGEAWPLSKAVDALGDAAKRAGVPGWVWIVGVFYPGLHVNVALAKGVLGFIERATGIAIPGTGAYVMPMVGRFPLKSDNVWNMLAMLVVLLPVLFVIYRLIVGLAKVSDPPSADDPEASGAAPDPRAQRPKLRAAWQAGKGLGTTAFGMWLMLLALLVGAMLFFIGPLVTLVRLLDITTLNALFASLTIPCLALTLTYAVILLIVNQLALFSLAHNRRGVASALTHAWRLVRASPWCAARATLVDVSLFVFVEIVARLIAAIGLWPIGGLAVVLTYVLYGFAGVTRAGFWAHTYRALGGLSAVDQVPGLSASAP